MDINFNDYDCKVLFGRYGNGNTAIQLVDKKDYELVAVASVNGEYLIGEDLVGIKDWSENEGMSEALIKAEIIKPTVAFVELSGFVTIGYYPLTEKAKQARMDAINGVNS